ncbi:NB-ARC domain-containing protein [Kamptonema sp. UHCC 0994]|uniref:NB-ARC domain-containing protein n=1 Tax=Kamptonema sp. UHCC 0994 TaxID=3031329 RepID=UPI0023B8B9BF|nr:NB-ARC domain-containing protein [Kamptonema sp. UHCC 0994]MDF0552063.1 NB-ARC domain-containing protein [Kamptonema sp. UHCC 0994]
MDVQEVLKLADDLVFVNTGKHLDNLQEVILRGTLQGQKYSKIAEESHCTEGHIKDIASELWKLLSEVSGEEINKSNFRATLERLQFSNVLNFTKDFVQINNVNFCENNSRSPKVPNLPPDEEPLNKANAKPKVREYLGEMPNFGSFYDRTPQLTTLKQWILHENTRLVAILGITGIGKTAIAVHLVEQIKHEFDYIFWRSLSTSPPLKTLQTNIVQFCRGGAPVPAPDPNGVPAPDTEERATTGGLPLLDYLRKYRCLLILDDVQTLNSSGQLAGNYKPGYEDYGTFFKQIAELYHHSCLILISSEKPKEISILEGENQPVRSLELSGLGAEAMGILREKGLADEEKWLELIEPYGGNPLWLKIVATMIQDVFNGSVAEALSYHTLFLGDLEAVLHQSFHRLSESEKQVMSWLASENLPVSLAQIPERIQLSHSELLKAIQSLGRRDLIEKIREGERNLFTLQPVIKEYVKTY